MISVALIGPDGCGKTTIARRLESTLPVPAKILYMGVSLDSSDAMLPTTRLLRALRRARGARPDNAGPRDPRELAARPRSGLRRASRELRGLVGLALRTAEQGYRQALAWSWQRRGYVVLFDRHYFPDYYAYDVAPEASDRPLHRRLHGWLLSHVHPKPDLLVYLDAPAELLHARKGEGTVELLERRRRDYLALRDVVDDFAVVDATQPEAKVAAEVAALICARLAPGRARSEATRHGVA